VLLGRPFGPEFFDERADLGFEGERRVLGRVVGGEIGDRLVELPEQGDRLG
jgi:hypothetical protein